MNYGYARVSTKTQEKNGNGLDLQELELQLAGAEEIYKDVCSGKQMNRPEFDKLLLKLQPGDTLIVTKLDRFARSAGEGSKLIEDLIDKEVTVVIKNMGRMDNTPTGKLIRNMMLSFAEFERDLICERMKEGKEVAKCKSGYREGRPKKYKRAQVVHALNLLQEGHTYKTVSEMTGISKSTLIRAQKTSTKIPRGASGLTNGKEAEHRGIALVDN